MNISLVWLVLVITYLCNNTFNSFSFIAHLHNKMSFALLKRELERDLEEYDNIKKQKLETTKDGKKKKPKPAKSNRHIRFYFIYSLRFS